MTLTSTSGLTFGVWLLQTSSQMNYSFHNYCWESCKKARHLQDCRSIFLSCHLEPSSVLSVVVFLRDAKEPLVPILVRLLPVPCMLDFYRALFIVTVHQWVCKYVRWYRRLVFLFFEMDISAQTCQSTCVLFSKKLVLSMKILPVFWNLFQNSWVSAPKTHLEWIANCTG